MAEPLLVVAIDGAGAVIGHAVLEAGATIRLPGAVAVLVLPGSVPAPPVGARLVWDRLRG